MTPYLAIIGVTVLAAGCASDSKRADYSDSKRQNLSKSDNTAATELDAASVSKIHFSKASAVLDAADKKHIRDQILAAKAQGEIDEIKVVVWADQKYPIESKKKLSDAQLKLAESRGDAIRNYVEEQLDIADVDIYNMAERPNAFERLFRTSDARVKTALERSGVNADTGLATPNQSQALVMVVMED